MSKFIESMNQKRGIKKDLDKRLDICKNMKKKKREHHTCKNTQDQMKCKLMREICEHEIKRRKGNTFEGFRGYNLIWILII